MLAIKNNIMAGNAARHLGTAYDSLAKSVERLSSGLRINSAKDDAAGLAVRELIRSDVAVLNQGSRNAQDGISMLQTMEGAMAVIDENLIRMQELAEQAATGSYSAAQRTIMNAEFSEMAAEIERIAGATKFNDISMLNSGTGSISIHVGTTSTIDVDKVNMTKAGLGINTGVEVMQATFGTTVSSTTDTYVTVAANNIDLLIQFGSEDAITVALDTGDYSLEGLLALINDETGALGFDPITGAEKNYDMASTYEAVAGEYQLRLSSRDETDTITVLDAHSRVDDAHGTITGWGGTLTTSSNAGADITADNYADAQAEGGLNILTTTAAVTAMVTITSAISTKDTARASFGYKMNRLESTIAILDIQAENLMTAESRISDVDVATEMAALTRTQVLAQAGISMLVQANAMPQMALTLLRG